MPLAHLASRITSFAPHVHFIHRHGWEKARAGSEIVARLEELISMGVQFARTYLR